MKTKILLTGGRGFIGKNIIECLGAKYTFLTPSHQDLDLTDATAVDDYFKNENVNLVIHAANVGGNRGQVDTQSVVFKNLQAFYSLIRAKKYFERMIVLGSGAEYDKSLPIPMVKESDFDKSVPKDEYGFAKYVMAKYAENVDYITHFRIFGIFGKYEDYQIRFISNSICKALLDLPITMKQNVYFDYIYVNDFIKIINNFIEKPAKEIHYNVGRGLPIDLLSIAKIILKVINKNLPIIIAKDGLNNEYTCDIGRLRAEFGDIEYTEMEVAISELVEYYKKELINIDKQIFLTDI